MSSPSSSRPRQPRDRRRAGVAVRLLDRDQALLRALARFRLARTGDLTRLFFGGVRADTAAVRLRRLYDAGFLTVHAGDRSQESIYSLGVEGRRWIEAQGLTAARVPFRPWEHHLATVQAWATVAITLHGQAGQQLLRVAPDWELRQDPDACAWLVPDLLLELRVGAKSLRVAIEVDWGTESLGVLDQKLAEYSHRHASASEETTDQLVVVMHNAPPSRLRQVQGMAERRCPGWAAVLMSNELAPWLAGRSPHASPVDSPYGKGREPVVSASAATPTHARGGGPSE